MKNIFIAVFIAAFVACKIHAQAFQINFHIDDYTNDTLIIGYYYGEKQLVKDTVIASKKGEFIFKGDEKLDEGMYLGLMKPDNSFVQFIVNDNEQKFDVKFSKNATSKLTFKNAPENKRFYDYMEYIKTKSEGVTPLRESMAKAKEAKSKDTVAIQIQMDNFDKEVKAYQQKFQTDYPGSFLTNLIKSTFDVDIPKYEGTKEDVDIKRFKYYKEHYFDNTDFDFPALIRTPYIHQKIDTYVKKLTVQNPDSLIISVGYILKKLDKNTEGQKYYLSHFLNEYANSKIIGMDKIFVYISDNYYAKGKTPWVKEENLKKILESANNIRPILIGEIMPNITTYKEDGTAVVLHNIKSPYTLIIFWAPDCGHCKKSMPDILKYADEYKDKGLFTYTICAKGGDKANTCWEGVKEKAMENLLNTGDQYQRYRNFIHLPSTPKIFILDENKKILFKDLPAEEIGNVMKEILKMKEEETKKKASKP